MPCVTVTKATKARVDNILSVMRLVQPDLTEDAFINALLDAAEGRSERGSSSSPDAPALKASSQAGRASRGTSIPRPVLKDFILDILEGEGGRATTQVIRTKLRKRLDAEGLLDSTALMGMPSDGRDARWWNHARFVRQELVDEGLLAPSTQHGVWELANRPERHHAAVPPRTGRMTGAEAGLSGDEQIRIALKCFSDVGERLPMSVFYAAVEAQMGGATLSDQGKSSLRFFINKRGVEAGYFQPGARGQRGWQATAKGIRYGKSA